jgi:dihydroxyacetone kinase-like protein
MTIAQAAPSTMGTLIGSGFMKAGKAVNGKTELEVTDFAEAIMQFVEGIILRGKAEPGDKTIIDSLYPAAQALTFAVNENKTLSEALQLGYKASLEGLEATKNMVPRHGKQVVYRDKSIGLQDPGATVGMLIMQTFAKYVTSDNQLLDDVSTIVR